MQHNSKWYREIFRVRKKRLTTNKEGIPTASNADASEVSLRKLLRHVSKDEIPDSKDLLSANELRTRLANLREPTPSLVVVGDIMLASRSRRFIKEHGPGYPFESVFPILDRSPIVVGNLEGPLTRRPRSPSTRNFSYRLKPELARSLKEAGIKIVALANNHLLDCGRQGVLDTLDALTQAGLRTLGAGPDETRAYDPVVQVADGRRIGLLNYYWNPRTAARGKLAGSAKDTTEKLQTGIRGLKEEVDSVVVIFHWGIPYVKEPLPENLMKARYAIDCGAAAVIGHHPHVVQPFEVYHGRPIFYSVGNFAFGSANSRAEGMAIGLNFDDDETNVLVFPMYVKNRDPRVAYQPKVVSGEAARRSLSRLKSSSGESGQMLRVKDGVGKINLPQ